MSRRNGAPQALLSPGRADGTAGGRPPVSEAYGVSSALLSVAGPSVRPAAARTDPGREAAAVSVPPEFRRQIPGSFLDHPENKLTVPSFLGAASPYPPDTPRRVNSHRCTVCDGILSKPKGSTYLVERGGWVKIGKTGNVASRLRALRGRVPGVLIPKGMDWSAPLTVIAVLPVDVEHTLHERFAACHVIGEWFRPDAAMRAWLAEAAQ